jgi:spermidine synthase
MRLPVQANPAPAQQLFGSHYNFDLVAAPMQSGSKSHARQSADGVRPALALIGFSAVVGQIVLMRALIVVFNGNEMSLGIMLSTWLLWTAAGSSLSSRLVLTGKHARRTVAALESLLAVSLPATLWIMNASKTVFQAVPGELVGPAPMLLTSLVCLSLFCAVSGALFVAAARMCEQESGLPARNAASLAYMLEAIGSGLGGVVASIVLLRCFESFQIAFIVTILNLSMAVFLLIPMSRKQLGAMAVAGALCAFLLVAYAAPWLHLSAQARLWNGFHVEASRDTIYGNLTVTQTGSLRSIYDNGVILANAPDEAAAEEAIHYALLEHPAPKRVLLIGGGVNGGITEALKHPAIERIDSVELDPALIGMARQFIPEQAAPLFADPRVHIHYADGRRYLRTAGESFDAIVLNVPDPQTAQLNRFYTAEFFKSARDHLAPGGLLALELRSSEETLSPALAEFLRCIQRTLAEVFPYVVVIPGDTIHFFAAVQPNVLTDNPQVLISRLRERNFKTQFVSQYFIPYRMMPDRMEQVREQLKPLKSTPVNRDLAPVAYSFDIVLWSTQFKGSYARWFQSAARIPFGTLVSAVFFTLLLIAALLALHRSPQRRARSASAYCAAATGFTLMALQLFLLLGFQSNYGYVYHQLAILIGLNMAGIAFGSWLSMRRIHLGNEPPQSAMAATQFLLAASVPALIFAISTMAKMTGAAETWLAAQCVFPALAALSGVLGGFQFPLAAEIYLHESSGRARIGALYAIDLLGGCLGALCLCTYLIPVFGFWKTAGLCAAINLPAGILAARVSLAN